MKIIQTRKTYEENMGFGSIVQFGAINVQFGNVSIFGHNFVASRILKGIVEIKLMHPHHFRSLKKDKK